MIAIKNDRSLVLGNELSCHELVNISFRQNNKSILKEKVTIT